MPESSVYERSTALCTDITSLFLPFQKCHLRAENEFAFLISPSADFVQNKVFFTSCKCKLVDLQEANVLSKTINNLYSKIYILFVQVLRFIKSHTFHLKNLAETL